MEKIINIECVNDYNKMFGIESLHPLVSVVDLSKAETWPIRFELNYGVYGLFLKDTKCGDIHYGRKIYDYREGTVVSFAPGQVSTVEIIEGQRPSALGLLFHPDLIHGTSLGQEIKNYSFFSYNSIEALHLSEREKAIFIDCLNKIRQELIHTTDKHSKRLISRNIELLLDYCMRFYDRQFITRSGADNDVLIQFEFLLNEYYEKNIQQECGLPSVKYFADKVCLSPNYFGDYIKKTTGKTAQDYIQNKIIELAKEKILNCKIPISQIAYELGFQYSQHFSRLFKNNVGRTPNQFKLESQFKLPHPFAKH